MRVFGGEGGVGECVAGEAWGEGVWAGGDEVWVADRGGGEDGCG